MASLLKETERTTPSSSENRRGKTILRSHLVDREEYFKEKRANLTASQNMSAAKDASLQNQLGGLQAPVMQRL